MRTLGNNKVSMGILLPVLALFLVTIMIPANIGNAEVNNVPQNSTLYTSVTSDDKWENASTITTENEPGMVADVPDSQPYSVIVNYFVGSIITSGDAAHGMVADSDGSQAWNHGTVITGGTNSYGMVASGDNSTINNNSGNGTDRASVQTSGAGSHGMVASGTGSSAHVNISDVVTTGNDAFGMYALNGAGVFNHLGGSILTSGTDSHGMVAEGVGSTATNEPGAVIRTTSADSYGMYALDGGQATNLGEVFTEGLSSHGMYALDGSIVVNLGTVRTLGAGSHGMVAENGSGSPSDPYAGAYNNTTIETSSDGSYGMYAVSSSRASNYGTIVTSGDNSHGMVASDGSWAYNHADITTNGADAFGMYALNSSFIFNYGADTIETWGDGSHGMVASNDSYAYSDGTIITHGSGSYGMAAFGGSTAISSGDITAEGINSVGMYAEGDGSSVTNNGLIIMKRVGSWGMEANGAGASALNTGSIEIRSDTWSRGGMRAYDGAIVRNTGTITAYTNLNGYGAAMWASQGSMAVNEGVVETYMENSHAMQAISGSGIVNLFGGSILTSGDNSFGMYADNDSRADNFGDITTSGSGALGMYALNSSWIFNYCAESIVTSGDGAHGMVADTDSYAYNDGSIITHGDGAFGMYALDASSADNYGTIVTSGDGAHGMVAEGNSIARNYLDITTHGDNAYGMLAFNSSEVHNILAAETIETWGAGSHGMVADTDSYAYNDGSIITHGDGAYGMYAVNASSADNYGDIETFGAGSHGMVISGDSDGYNEGTVTVSAGSDAVHVLGGSRFINAGELDAPEDRSAVVASDGSSVLLLDGTVLVHTHTLTGDGTSSLDVYMSEDLAAQVQGFGNMTKRGTGTLLVEEGSFTGDLSNEEGTLEIEDGTRFDVANITQLADATLYVHVNPDSSTLESAIPLWVSGDAWMDGSMRADMTSATGVGFYNFIRATYYEGEPVTTFENLDPLFLAYGPAWVDGWDNDYHYRTLLGYSFSEAALGLVAAVDDWNMLRWIMGNHLQDVAESMKEMEVGEKKIHAHALGGTTSRDPADSASAGFDSTQKGISVGFDKKSNENTVWGLYAGYTEKDIDFTGLPMVGSDWESQDTWHIGGYISRKWDRWIFSNTLTYRSTNHDTFRKQMGGDATASFDSWAITNDLRLGYVAKEIGEGSNWQVIPEVGLNVGYFDRGGYTEKNGFTYGDFDTTVVESVLGVRFRGEYERADGSKFVPQARLAWVHVLSGNDITIDQSWGGTTYWFTEYLDDDYFVADLGLSLYNMNDMDISLNYGGRFSDNSTTHGGWLRLEWRF